MMKGAILLALLLLWFGWHRADPLLVSGIGVYILYCALRVDDGAVQALLDRAQPDAERQKIIDIINAWSAIRG